VQFRRQIYKLTDVPAKRPDCCMLVFISDIAQSTANYRTANSNRIRYLLILANSGQGVKLMMSLILSFVLVIQGSLSSVGAPPQRPAEWRLQVCRGRRHPCASRPVHGCHWCGCDAKPIRWSWAVTKSDRSHGHAHTVTGICEVRCASLSTFAAAVHHNVAEISIRYRVSMRISVP